VPARVSASAGDAGSTRRRFAVSGGLAGAGRVADSPAVTQPVDELLTLGVERAYLGLDVGRDAVEADEERELPVAERVEDLSVVAAGPHRVPVGDEGQGGDVLAGFDEIPDGAADAGEAETGVEERRHDSQRHEILERVPGRPPGGRRDQAGPLPRAELRHRAAGQAGGLGGREAHGKSRFRTGRRAASAHASGGRRSRTRS